MKKTGYVYVRIGENIADGQTSVDQVMTTWLESPPHRDNMMADFTDMGAARIDDDEKVSYWCVVFGVSVPRLKPNEAAAAVLKEWNRQRKEQKQSLLRSEPKLARAAMATTKAMADKESSTIENDPFKLIGDRGPQAREMRLTLSISVPTAVEAAKSLVEDDPAQLAKFNEVGVGYAISKSGKPYWWSPIFSRSVARSRADRLRESAEKKDEPSVKARGAVRLWACFSDDFALSGSAGDVPDSRHERLDPQTKRSRPGRPRPRYRRLNRVRVVASHGQIAIPKLHLANPISESASIADIC